jgi:hypothetical protein
MPDLRDFAGRPIRLTEERRWHIFERPEMVGLEGAIAAAVADPVVVVESLRDPTVWLYYRYCTGTPVGDKFLCVVVKHAQDDGFVVTAYLTDQIKKGSPIWPAEN